MIDRIIDEILTEMQRKITYEQLKDLEGVLVRKFHGLTVQKKC